MKPDILSIVIPVWNEAESIRELYSEITSNIKIFTKNYELIFVDDGSSDSTESTLKELRRQDAQMRWIKFRSHFGKSAALAAGFKHISGSVIVTIDGDLQDDPSEIKKLIEKINEGFDVVSGWKLNRKDPISKRVLSKIFNFVTAQTSGIKLHDFNCGLKAYRREVLEEISIYGELHRFIPLLAAWKGFKIAEVRVLHRPRKYGKTKYGHARILNGFLDLFTVLFLTRFVKKPSHLFGTIGSVITGLGLLINGYIAYLRFSYGNIQNRYPLLFLGILLTIVGIQFVSTGLLAELVTFGQNKLEPEYSIKERSE